MTMIFNHDLYDAYNRNGYRVQKTKGFSYKNEALVNDEKARYKQAKEAFELKWQKKPGVAYHDALAWLAQSGWLTVVLPDGVVGIDVDGSEHKVKQIHDLCDGKSIGVHKSRNGHHYILKLPAGFPNLKASVDLMSRCGLELTYRTGGKANIIVEPSDAPHRKWEKFVDNDKLDDMPEALQPLDTKNINQVKTALAWQLRYAGQNGIIKIDTHINMSFVGWLTRKLGYNETEVCEMVELCLGDRYNGAVIKASFQRAKELEIAKAGGELFQALNEAGMTWVCKLTEILAKYASKEHPELVAATKGLSSEQLVNHVKHYAKEHGIIYFDKGFFALEGRVYKEMRDEDIESDMFKLLDKHFTSGRLSNMMRALGCHTNVKEANVSNHMLLSDGMVYDLETLSLRDRAPNEVFFNQLNVKMDSAAKCPRFLQFLEEIFPGRPEIIPLIQEFMGYTLTPWTTFASALVFKGEGANGKSVLLNVWEHILGTHNVSHVTMSQLKDKFTTVQVRGKLLNVSSEVGSRDVALDELLKKLISGERVQGEKKGIQPFEFTPFAKYIFATNNTIVTTDRSSGFNRRFIYIPFVCDFHKVLRKKMDPWLTDKLKLEGDAIFAWALEGLKRLKVRGMLDIPQCLIDNTAEEQNKNNPVFEFANEHLFWSSEEKFIPNAIIHEEYKKFCAMNGYKALSSVPFFVGLRRVISGNIEKIAKTRKGDRGFLNIWIRPVPYDMATRSIMMEVLKLQETTILNKVSVCESYDESEPF